MDSRPTFYFGAEQVDRARRAQNGRQGACLGVRGRDDRLPAARQDIRSTGVASDPKQR